MATTREIIHFFSFSFFENEKLYAPRDEQCYFCLVVHHSTRKNSHQFIFPNSVYHKQIKF